MTEYRIQFQWDPEAKVWIATSTDIPELILESSSFDVLLERVRYAVPELLELNGYENINLPLCIQPSERYERMYA